MGDSSSDELISSYLDEPRFVEREWLAERVESPLSDPDCRFVLVTGEPGSGKTALMAWLARRHPRSLRYFIRRDSRSPLNAGDARSLLLELGGQLAALWPAAFEPRGLEIVIEQSAYEIAREGRLVGVSIKELTASPFWQAAVRVQQRAGTVAGEAVAVAIERATFEERMLEVSNLQFMALIGPATVLLNEHPDTRLLIVIDALDELREVGGAETALDWLAACPQLPSNIRLIVTSRRDNQLLASFRSMQGRWLREVEIPEHAEEVRRDLTRYAGRFVTEPAVAAALLQAEVSADRFVADSVARADGNFQYLVALCRGIDGAIGAQASSPGADRDDVAARLLDLLKLDGLPPGLDALYAHFIGQVHQRIRGTSVEVEGATPASRTFLPAWEGLYQPTLGVLAVAFEPLATEQMWRLSSTGAQERWTRRALQDLGQFLERKADGIVLYHASLADFLLSPLTKASYPDYYLDPADWHRRIAWSAIDTCRRDWLSCADDYAVGYVHAHLAEAVHALAPGPARSAAADELFKLVQEDSYLRAQLFRFPAQPLRSRDVIEAALRTAVILEDLPVMVTLIWLLGENGQSIRAETPLAGLAVGGPARGWLLADGLDPLVRVTWHLLMAWQLKNQGRSAEARETLERISPDELARTVNTEFWHDWQGPYLAELLPQVEDVHPARALDIAQMIAGLDRSYLVRLATELGKSDFALEVARTFDGDVSGMIADVVRARLAAGDLRGAERDVQEIEYAPLRVQMLARLSRAYAEIGHEAAADRWLARAAELADRPDMELGRDDLAALCAALVTGGRHLEAERRALQARSAGDRAVVIVSLAAAKGLAGTAEEKAAVMSRARRILDEGDVWSRVPHAAGRVAALALEIGAVEAAISIARRLDHVLIRDDVVLAICRDRARLHGQAGLRAVAARLAPILRPSAALASLYAQYGDTDSALRTAYRMVERYVVVDPGGGREERTDTDGTNARKAHALAAVGGELARRGMVQTAQQIFTKAAALAIEVTRGYGPIDSLRGIAREQARGGLLDDAVETYARGLGFSDAPARDGQQQARDTLLGELAVVRARAGDDQGAWQAAGEIPDKWPRSQALTAVLGEQGTAGRVDQALRTSQDDCLQDAPDKILRMIALAAAAHDAVAAQAIASRISETQLRLWTSIAVAEFSAASPPDTGQEAVLTALRAAVKDFSGRQPADAGLLRDHVRAIAAGAGALARLGCAEHARRYFIRARELLAVSRDRPGLVALDEARKALIAELARAGLADDALVALDLLHDDWRVGEAIDVIARDIAAHDRPGELAARIAELEAPPRCRSYARLAEAMRQVGQDGSEFLVMAVATASAVTEESERADCLAAIAAAQVALGASDDAIRTILAVQADRYRYRLGLATALVRSGDHDRFLKLLGSCVGDIESAAHVCCLLMRAWPGSAEQIAARALRQ